ncbi:MAG: polyprenol phosphomannose-dependent alpha 1,6 mannosyltransferase MptB [Propionibacteriaceae bacterium]|jgi:alpha-1,6-mannosyltransferase|nr:polyprenol phosphomannose-dependent alpha 1,6 mannosyltransferase MptB [Propionibacteriaceae bacterium]
MATTAQLAPPATPERTLTWWRRIGRQLAEAWSHRPVKLGLAGTVAIEIGSFTPAYLPQSSPLWEPLRNLHLDGPAVKIIGTILVMAGIWLLVNGWFQLRHHSDRPAQPWAILTIWSLPLLFGPPIFSHDAYSYAAQGWLIHNHLNPYDVGPGAMPGSFADQVATVWRDTPAPYGPLSLQMSHALVDLSGFYATVSAELQRLPAVLGVALIVVFLPRLAQRVGADQSTVIWFACLNPLLVIDYVGGAHNDAAMMGLVVLALWVSACPRTRLASLSLNGYWLLGAMLIGVAAAIKQPAFLAALALPLLAGPLPQWRRWRSAVTAIVKMLLSLLVSVAVFIVISQACGLGYGWINAIDVPGSVTTASPTSLIGEMVQWCVDQTSAHAGIVGDRTYITWVQFIGTTLGFALIAVFAVWIGRRQPLKALSWSWLAIAFLGPALHSWYVLWGGLLVPLSPSGRSMPRIAVGVTVVLLSFSAINLAWRNDLWAIGAAAAALLVWLAVLHELGRHRASTPETPVDAVASPE